jgi:hypothetical protein
MPSFFSSSGVKEIRASWATYFTSISEDDMRGSVKFQMEIFKFYLAGNRSGSMLITGKRELPFKTDINLRQTCV